MIARSRLLLVATLSVLGWHAALADNYGAIAYSATGGAASYSYDYRNRGAAEEAALQRCNKDSADCQVVVWFRNACGALAVGPHGIGHAWADGRSAAEQSALNYCGQYGDGCEIKMWACTSR